ncbi:MAG: CCA tRNA nucleotidyltransferase [Alphaproteobacteria bacterium]|nr:CCA tRNA nucleotidyltransferase [Alphaproteobacteria bacterium]
MFIPEYLDMSKIIKSERIYKLFDAVENHGGTIRFVGGAVRDTLAGLSGFDLDLATDLTPDELIEACQDAYLKTVPIGLKFDSIGVVIDNQILKISSLRRKDGAKNQIGQGFTDDWSADASRRDLTINAVYADLHGNVFDYYDGIQDLKNGIVRFIGDPTERIKEDHLRIMRFFRFHAKFSKTPINAPALKACIKFKNDLRNISIERVRDELFKLLAAPRAAETMKIIYDHDILGYFLPASDHLDALERLSQIVADAQYEGNFLRRLFVLYQPTAAQAENIANVLRFTKKQKDQFLQWAKITLSTEHMASSHARLKFIYRYGKQFLIDKILLTVAIENIEAPHLNEVLSEIEGSIVPIFPVIGRDLIGFIAQSHIKQALSVLEQQWMDSNFTLTRQELLDAAKNIK